MCLAIFKPASVRIPISSLSSGWVANSDGGGFAYTHGGKIHVVKGLMTLSEFMAAYRAAEEKFPGSPFLIHFRIRSQGDRSSENTHPFIMPNGAALIHNGTIDGTDAVYDKGKSDTALFVEKYGKVLTFKNVEKTKEDLEAALNYNKIVILYGNGKRHILNEKLGVWHEDVWYSNHTFKPRNTAYAGGSNCGWN